MNAELYFSDPTTFNDPFDFAPSPLYSPDVMEKVQAARVAGEAPVTVAPRGQSEGNRLARARHLENATLEAIRRVAAQFGVCSLSASSDSVLMWSHYADYHRGICLRFTRSKDGVRLRSPFVKNGRAMFSAAQPVIYSPNRPLLDYILDDRDKKIASMMMTKSVDWAYEKEWRMIAPDGPGVYSFSPARLDGIIFGSQILSEKRKMVLDWINKSDRHVEVLQAHLNNQRYEIDIGPCIVRDDG